MWACRFLENCILDFLLGFKEVVNFAVYRVIWNSVNIIRLQDYLQHFLKSISVLWMYKIFTMQVWVVIATLKEEEVSPKVLNFRWLYLISFTRRITLEIGRCKNKSLGAKIDNKNHWTIFNIQTSQSIRFPPFDRLSKSPEKFISPLFSRVSASNRV